MSKRSHYSRRTVLKAMAVGASANALSKNLPGLLAQSSPNAASQFLWPENGTLLPDEGWRLWVDTKALWESDKIFLPEDIAWINGRLCGKGTPLPVNPPTGGWNVLGTQAGKQVILPTSVEQHFWGMYGAGKDGKPRPYTPQEYRYAKAPSGAPADDDVPQNGAYFGVSWFYRSIDIPASMRGKRIFLHVRAAHLRAEVYLNGQLCGYSIMEELPFDADLTQAARPGGENRLTIRITNPFGRFDWVDGLNAAWGAVSLYRSHGFGALDRGMSLSAHPAAIRISDAWALNTSDPRTLVAYARVEASNTSAHVRFELIDPSSGKVLVTTDGVYDDKTSLIRATITHGDARLWDISKPHLYYLRITAAAPNSDLDARTIPVAFRAYGPTGIGTNAMFRLNGRRIRLYSAISWGYWGLNGMFPVPELAEKEVRAAQELGLNCLNFHRNLAKEDVLRKHDELGVLRYLEPGAGKMAIGRLPHPAAPNAPGTVMEQPETEAEKFAQRFMFVKCVEMVKAFRSHPSIVEYCLQNELGADLNNPSTLAVLKAMHNEDPSRCVVLNDGFVARGAAQAWYAPWVLDASGKPVEGTLYRSDKEKWGAWWDNHQGAGDQWYDAFYQSPTEFTYRAPYKDVITEFGEMEGCARPDNHPLMVHQITTTYAKYGGDSYDLVDHEEIIAGYERFLDRWNFRKAFPTSESVFRACGRTCYESWKNYMENARSSDWLDFGAISGWESTAIENHSGIVDNLRNFKSDPELIRGSLLPVRPIAKQRSLVIEQGQPATFDLYLANDTGHAATGELTFTMISPSGIRHRLFQCPAPSQSPDVFSYLLKEGFTTPPLTEQGLYRFRFAISSLPRATQSKELWVTRSEFKPRKELRVAVSGITPRLRTQLDSFVKTLDYVPGESYDLIVSAGRTATTKNEGPRGETTGEAMPRTNNGHKPEPGEGLQPTELGAFAPGMLDSVRAGASLLAIPQADTLSEGLARALAQAGCFQYHGAVGDFRAPWMGDWYFLREHALFSGMPVNCAMGGFYQAPGRQSNGLLIERAPNGPEIEVMVGYSRDHDRQVGAGTFTTRLGKGKVLFHRVPDMHSVMQQRFLANALLWLTS